MTIDKSDCQKEESIGINEIFAKSIRLFRERLLKNEHPGDPQKVRKTKGNGNTKLEVDRTLVFFTGRFPACSVPVGPSL